MTEKQIIEWAREAGGSFQKDNAGEFCSVESYDGSMARFAALVAAHAKAEERERCAKVCDELHYPWKWDDEPDSDSGPRSCAAAIRALKD